MSAIHTSPASPRSAPQTLAIRVPNAFIGPGTSEIDVTVTRSTPVGAAGLRKRLTVGSSDDYEEIPANPSATHKPIVSRLGVSRNVTFQPGQASVTIPVPVPPVPAGFGSVQVVLGASLPGMSFKNWPAVTSFTVFASADKVPPTIVATMLTSQGLSLTFSKPMDPSTVANINNYLVQIVPTTPAFPETIALRAAVYDPSAQTVTLIPTKPVDPASDYTVSSGPPPIAGTRVLTDLEGNPIDNSIDNSPGSFLVPVGRDLWTA
jgi:hypothetical protein